jgi:hypothetical protein
MVEKHQLLMEAHYKQSHEFRSSISLFIPQRCFLINCCNVRVEHEKGTKLRSPNFHISTTRLAVHNIPKDMTEKELKQLFIQAVKSRASKQEPVLKQVLPLNFLHICFYLCVSLLSYFTV